eukprot:4419905-Pyramimonas_sp.AAC.1
MNVSHVNIGCDSCQHSDVESTMMRDARQQKLKAGGIASHAPSHAICSPLAETPAHGSSTSEMFLSCWK